MKIPVIAAILISGMLSGVCVAQPARHIEAGNGGMEQPPVPGASRNRTRALKTTFDNKYDKVLRLLQRDHRLVRKIEKTADEFGIDPIHIIGAIVGEHTYNVDAYDTAQSYYIKAISYLKGSIDFEYDGESVEDFIARPQFERCDDLSGSRDLWTCRETVWEEKFRGKTVDGKTFPNNRLSAVFFQPFYAGQTFGLGQLNPLTALMMTDRVHEVTGAHRLDYKDGKEVYRAIMDPDETLPYIAATLEAAIEDYRKIAGFDIADNPGLTATLYNTGNSDLRARELAKKNRSRSTKVVPQVNYYGWLVNEKEAELRALLDT